MAFNKARALQEAEKSVSQGKISQAVKQYLEIAQYDPRDLNLLNTAGDLCVRDRNIPEALRVFRKLADIYVREGFVLRAIAIYKKIIKLDQTAVDPVAKLAELYAAQGLAREARELYAQALEMCQRTNQREKALEVMRKIVAGEPESISHRLRLAEFIEALGRKPEAATAYVEAAHVALDQNDSPTAARALAKCAELDDTNAQLPSLRERLGATERESKTQERDVESPAEASLPLHAGVGSAGEAGLSAPPPRPSTSAESQTAAVEMPPILNSTDTAAKAAAAELAAASQDLDLSTEWESAAVGAGSSSMHSEAAAPEATEPAPVSSPPESASPAFNYEESRPEIDFYLASGFIEQARAVVETLESKYPGNADVAELRARLEERVQAPSASEERAVSLEAGPAEGLTEQPDLQPASTQEPELVSEPKIGEPGKAGTAAVQEPEWTPDDANAAHLEPPPSVPDVARSEREQMTASGAAAGGDNLLESLSADLESAWPGLEPEAPAAPSKAGSAAPEGALPDVSASLGAMLNELEEETPAAAEHEDPHTHYDLGVAFREMGLLDEAIGEFQKVVKAAREGEYPPQFLGACSLLGLCFMDKSMPGIAVKWFERALQSPHLDNEAVIALQYDLGLAYEQAGDEQTALQRFLEVYSQNIDYREVADKVRLLQQKS